MKDGNSTKINENIENYDDLFISPKIDSYAVVKNIKENNKEENKASKITRFF